MNIPLHPHSAPSPAVVVPPETIHRFTVKEYHRMAEVGILKSGSRIELLDGWIVDTMAPNPPHCYLLTKLTRTLLGLLPAALPIRFQQPITLATSEPEPAFAVVRGPDTLYSSRHPGPRDIYLLVEVADSSFLNDRKLKLVLYAQARVPECWIVNLVESKVQVYTQPRAGKKPAYRQCKEYGRGQSVPLVIADQEIAQLPVGELLPP